MSNKIFFSVVIPIHNQRKSLEITLAKFSEQDYPRDQYEIILIDDGSDNLDEAFDNKWTSAIENIVIVHQKKRGRASARNTGIEKAKGDYIIFCDGDRFPEKSFISKYYEVIKKNNYNEKIVYIGCPMDYFGNINNVDDESKVIRYSRTSQYYKKISNIYNDEGYTSSDIDWASFLVGNSCVNSKMLNTADGFDPNFKTWGFEHFELAYRMKTYGASFRLCCNIRNFHIPHSSGSSFYSEAIRSSVNFMEAKYKRSFIDLEKFITGKIALQDFEEAFSGKISEFLYTKQPIFYKL